MGKCVRMRFEVSGSEKWYDGVISAYNGVTGKYGVYFPCDKETVEVSLDDEDMEFID